MKYKNKITGVFAAFEGSPDSNWVKLTDKENVEAILLEIKLKKIKQLAFNRSQKAENSSVVYDGNSYSNSQNARIAILNYALLLESDESASYFTYPNKNVIELSKSDFEALRKLIQDNEITLREKEIELITQINNCTTIKEIEAIDITLN